MLPPSPSKNKQDPIFSVSQRADSSIIEVQHDLDIATTGTLENAISHAALATELRIIVSLTQCSYCDAGGLRTLLGAKARLGKRLCIVVPRHGSVRRIIDITELAGPLGLYDDLDLALGSEANSE